MPMASSSCATSRSPGRSRPRSASRASATRSGSSRTTRRPIATRLAARFGGGVVPPERFITGASAAARYTIARHPGRPLFVISAPDALREFEGQTLLDADAVDALPPGGLGAVVIGDGGDDLSYRNLDVAFRAVRRGAELVAMHRNPWWLTSRGETIDSGAWVAGLEFASGRRAVLCGKPSPVVFRQAVAALAEDVGHPRLRRWDVVMVGDDPSSDIAGAKRVGLRGALVLTGKVDAAAADVARQGPNGTRPDVVAPSLADLVAALDYVPRKDSGPGGGPQRFRAARPRSPGSLPLGRDHHLVVGEDRPVLPDRCARGTTQP